MLYVFGAFLLLTGVKMWWAAGKEPDLESNPALKLLRRVLPVSPQFDGEKFFTMANGRRMATPLLLVIALVGLTDVIFAVDSIPAIFAITTDPFIVLTSNIFAILGLRAMYFLLAAMAAKFHLLSYGLAVVLVFIGTKMLLIDIVKIPVLLSLGVVVAVLGITMLWSMKTTPRLHDRLRRRGAGGARGVQAEPLMRPSVNIQMRIVLTRARVVTMNSSMTWPIAPHRPVRPWLSVAVLAGHGLLFWALLQLNVIESVVRHAAPLMVSIVSPDRPPEPMRTLQVQTPRPALPQVVLAMPVPEVVVQRDNPPPTLTVQAAPAPVTPPAAPSLAPPAPPAPPPPPAVQKVPASALRYLVEPPVEVPRLSRRMRESGTVLLHVVVDLRGLPRSVTLQRSSGFDRLDQQALGAMRQARFVPCTDGGKPVECESIAPIVYELEN